MTCSNFFHEARRGLRALVVALALVAPASAHAQLDLCGCEGLPSLGAFDTSVTGAGSGFANAGASINFAPNPDTIVIPLPPDGVLVFDSFNVTNNPQQAQNAEVFFSRNAANTPVTLLVKGNVTISSGDRINISGGVGGSGSAGSFGGGGGPSTGGFGGGDGAYQLVNFGEAGGDGLGPGGGSGAGAGETAGGGTFVGLPELRPLLGGSGGGGGRSTGGASGCSAGGGGGGAGGILIASNGTVTVTGEIRANGGNGGSRSSTTCASSGGGGSGGAIRIVALNINGGGTMNATGGTGAGAPSGAIGSPGRIRLEAISNTFSATGTNPVASRGVPGPIVDPIQPMVTITGIDGAVTPVTPQGFRGQIDMIVPAPGDVVIDLETIDVPAGTTVEVKIKPKVQTALIQTLTSEVLLEPLNCTDGVCIAAVLESLEPGGYIVEARATFLAPSP